MRSPKKATPAEAGMVCNDCQCIVLIMIVRQAIQCEATAAGMCFEQQKPARCGLLYYATLFCLISRTAPWLFVDDKFMNSTSNLTWRRGVVLDLRHASHRVQVSHLKSSWSMAALSYYKGSPAD